jgi:hypothetical protein
MNITILLEETTISGVAQIAMTHADALTARGHHVRIVTTGEPVSWRSSRAEWTYVDTLPTEGIPAGSLPPLVDEEFFSDHNPREHEPLRVLLCGASQEESLGIDDGYGAAAHARWFHQKFDLIRVSPWAPSREEPLDSVQEFHVGLTTRELTRLMHSCDVLVAADHADAGFGLFAAEALASRVPCVMTEVPSYLSFDEVRDFALFAPEQNAVELGERLIELLSDEELRDRLRDRGRQVARQWRAELQAERLERFFLEWRG